LSGPNTGVTNWNFPAFNAEAKRLRDLGYEVVNPAEINPDGTLPWVQCLRMDIKALCDYHILALPPGWENSKSAHLELHIAHRLDLKVVMVEKLT
jgi:hypothetical protein